MNYLFNKALYRFIFLRWGKVMESNLLKYKLNGIYKSLNI